MQMNTQEVEIAVAEFEEETEFDGEGPSSMTTTATRSINVFLLLWTLGVNCLISYPMATLILIAKPFDLVKIYGPDSDGRRILGCIYLALAAVSTIVAFQDCHAKRLILSLPVYSLQCMYQFATVFSLGFGSPVVIANVALLVLQILTLWLNKATLPEIYRSLEPSTNNQ